MAIVDLSIDADAAVGRLMRFLAVEGVTGHEKAIGLEVDKALREAGVPRAAIRYDTANERIPVPTQTGNLIVKLPGTRPGAPRLLFSTHLDTVPLCAGAVPVRSKNRITAKGATALGGDNRTGVACLVTLAATLLERQIAAPAVDAAVHGARGERPVRRALPRPGRPGRRGDGLQRGRQGAGRPDRRGRGGGSLGGGDRRPGVACRRPPGAGHLGDDGRRRWRWRGGAASGWFGKIRKDGREGTSNVGVFGGRDGRAPARRPTSSPITSTSAASRAATTRRSCKAIVAAWRQAFADAAGQVTDDKGRPAKVKFTSRLDYHPFRLKDDAPVVRHAVRAAEGLGLTPDAEGGQRRPRRQLAGAPRHPDGDVRRGAERHPHDGGIRGRETVRGRLPDGVGVGYAGGVNRARGLHRLVL